MLISYEPDFMEGLDEWVSIRLVFSGCLKGSSGRPCPGCHNPFLWDFGNQGIGTTDFEVVSNITNAVEKLKLRLKEWKSDGVEFDGVVSVGGEPLDQNVFEVESIVNAIKEEYPNIKIFVYTGYLKKEIENNEKLLFHPFVAMSDFLKTGPYDSETPPKENSKLASGNQELWRMKNGKFFELKSF